MIGLNKILEDTVNYSKRSIEKEPATLERVLGKYSCGEDGPALVISADVFEGHTSGVHAFRKVYKALSQMGVPLKGEVTGLAGNINTRKKGILTQLKQSLSIEDGFSSYHTDTPGYNEATEFVDLIEEYEKASSSATNGTYFLDLKVSSNIRQPYLCSSSNPHACQFAGQFPLLSIRGMEEYVTDHMGFYLNAKCYVGCTFFVGSSGPYDAEQLFEAAIWLALVNSGCVEKSDVPNFSFHERILENTFEEELKSFEVVYKYSIQEDEFFRMLPGFETFQKIKQGQLLATSDGGAVVSQWEGRIFMPLYHTQCQDGFFVLKEY